jgi:hypothetical protein
MKLKFLCLAGKISGIIEKTCPPCPKRQGRTGYVPFFSSG